MSAKLVLILFFVEVFCQNVKNVGDDDLLEFIKDKDKLIVLFTKPNCPKCTQYEKLVENLQKDFKEHVNAEVVKVVDSHLARLYSPNKEPALVFFRHGIPLLYSDEPDENEIFGFFEKNQSPAVKELTDKIFEHITQAATGATTGDWFVMFYGASCVECQRLHAVWEGVGATLRGRVNVARVDANLGGVNTAKRFNVNKLPAFFFFRLGKVYRYDLPKNDVKSFVAFAQEWYKNARGEPVPLLASPFDELVDWCVQMIKQSISFGLDFVDKNPWVWPVGIAGVAGFSLVLLTAVIAVFKARGSKSNVQAKKEKKSK